VGQPGGMNHQADGGPESPLSGIRVRLADGREVPRCSTPSLPPAEKLGHGVFSSQHTAPDDRKEAGWPMPSW